MTFSRGHGNPEHGRLLDYVQKSLGQRGYDQAFMNRLKNGLRDLRRDRERADYEPRDRVDERDAREGLRRAEQMLKDLRLPL